MTVLSDAAVRRLRGLDGTVELATDRYSFVREIGRGGMGTVWLATDSVLQREVAIKVPTTAASDERERRLQLEVRALARLEHPGIVPIHDSGRLADGRLFYVMKRVQGRTLRDHLPGLADEGARLSIFERLCDPVAFAHAQGFVHRDLKPDNVMLGAFGEVMVMDWGIAKMLGDDGAVQSDHASGANGGGTSAGTVLGTRGFMSPEQAGLRPGPVDERSDIYSLGAILFMLLTGNAPPAGEAAQALAGRRDIPAPLRSICARALASEPAERYATVKALSEDIARYRSHRPVHAHKESLVERARRFGRAYRTAILLILAYVLMRAIVAVATGR